MNKKTSPNEDLLAPYRELWRRAMAQIGAGKNAQEAIGELSSALGLLAKQFHEAENLFGIANAANMASGATPPPNTERPLIIPPRRKKLTQSERSEIIKKTATDLALDSGEAVNIRKVADAIAARGIDLNTPVPGTMIGNVLNKSPNWERIEKGVFQHKGLAK
jgi:hypothetical protein